MINEFEKKRLVDLFGVRIGLALCRSDITYNVLCDWYFNDILRQKLLRVRGFGKISVLIVYSKLENYLLSCL